MVSTRSMSAAKKTDAQNLKIAARSTKKTSAEISRTRKRETTQQKLMNEEAFKDFLKTHLFEWMYPYEIRRQMSYPFGPPEEFKKFEDRGRAEWELLRESEKAYHLHRVQIREARKQAMRKMELGKKLTDKIEKEAFQEMEGAAFTSFSYGLFKEEYLKEGPIDPKTFPKQYSKSMKAADLKWDSMKFEEKAPYFQPIWWTE